MIMWKKALAPYIKHLESPSSSMNVILFSPPECQHSVHISVYLPTAGRDEEFYEEITALHHRLLELIMLFPHAPLYIRGDINVNPKNKKRSEIFAQLCKDMNLIRVNLNHPTYHHFVGSGSSDSQIDALLHTNGFKETVSNLLCGLTDPLITSHHDIIVSSFSLPKMQENQALEPAASAPRMSNNRVKIMWSEDGIAQYRSCAAPLLQKLRDTWLHSESESSVSILLGATNAFLSLCAKSTNKHLDLSRQTLKSNLRKPKCINDSEKKLRKIHFQLKHCLPQNLDHLLIKYKAAKKEHRGLIRKHRMKEASTRDIALNTVCSDDPSPAYRVLRNLKRNGVSKVSTIKVGSKTFVNDAVPDGIYCSIEELKTGQDNDARSFEAIDFHEEYRLILDICRSGKKIPPMPHLKASEILNRLKKHVNDFYSITSLHYLHAGEEGLEHFTVILNTIIKNINLSGLAELNTIYACVLYKGHHKDKTDARSYRTISTCPLLSKALDMYVRELSVGEWNEAQAETQYSGEGMSHDLASILLTESIQYSLNVLKKPVYALFLDAKAAFDRLHPHILARNLVLTGASDQRLLYIDNRLSNRQTIVEYDHHLMGPIFDSRGLEQGGVSSSDLYKLYNNEQASVSQCSNLGVPIKSCNISCISLADDAVLLSNSIIDLNNLLYLTKSYCQKYDVILVPEKTQLLAFHNEKYAAEVEYIKSTSLISLAGKEVPFSSEAEHLGVVCSEMTSNTAHILSRISAHRAKIFSLLPAGLAYGHLASTAATLKVERMCALPVLLSGMSTLVLSKRDISILSDHFKKILRLIMKLPDRTPEPVIFFLAGTLPLPAHLHLRKLSLFGMICRLKGNVLHSIGRIMLTDCKPAAKSWFQDIRNICVQYALPHPLDLLNNPPPKLHFKKLCKEQVHLYWREKLTSMSDIPSLKFLITPFLSLLKPHPIWTSLDGNPYQAKAAKVQALFLSGRYRTERLCRFWSSNSNGYCLLDSCLNLKYFDDYSHILLHCSGLIDERRRLVSFTKSFLAANSEAESIVNEYLLYSNDDDIRLQFLLDCSVLPLVIQSQQSGTDIINVLFRVTRTWCRSLHVARSRKLGRFYD